MSRKPLCGLLGILLSASGPAAALTYEGVNLSGAEFGHSLLPPIDPPAPILPGVYGTTYIYPNQGEVDYYLSRGMNTFRLPFLWERLQPTLGGAFNSAEMARLTTFVTETTAKGGHVILDPHDFGRYYPVGEIGTAVSDAAFAQFWTQLAAPFAGNDRVIFGLMNEPQGGTTENWFDAAQAAVTAIRGVALADNLILVPGNGYTGAWSWTEDWYGTPNADVMGALDDPADNFAFDVHLYLDQNHSGNSSEIFWTDVPGQLAAITNWLGATGHQAFLGEFGMAIGPDQQAAATDLLTYLEANSDVWQGWAWWGGGPWWPDDYRFRLDPVDGVDAEQMAYLAPFLAVPEPSPGWLLLVAALGYAAACTARNFTSPISSSSASSATRRNPSVASVSATCRLPS